MMMLCKVNFKPSFSLLIKALLGEERKAALFQFLITLPAFSLLYFMCYARLLPPSNLPPRVEANKKEIKNRRKKFLNKFFKMHEMFLLNSCALLSLVL